MIEILPEDIEKFLSTKEFKGLKLEMDKNQIIENFGQPIEYEPQKGKNHEILSYGILCIYLLFERVVGFSFDYQKNEYYEENFKYSPMEKENVLFFLKKNNILYSENILLKGSEGDTFDTFDGISIGFKDDKLLNFGILKLKH